jgi:cohesin loading factor subunit SCC2
VVENLTHDYKALVMLLKSCDGKSLVRVLLKGINCYSGRLQPALKAASGKGMDGRSLSMIILIVSLLVEHCDFDRIGQDHPGMSNTEGIYLRLSGSP